MSGFCLIVLYLLFIPAAVRTMAWLNPYAAGG